VYDRLEDGSRATGFLCEAMRSRARDISDPAAGAPGGGGDGATRTKPSGTSSA
jgi:hypothetical protein